MRNVAITIPGARERISPLSHEKCRHWLFMEPVRSLARLAMRNVAIGAAPGAREKLGSFSYEKCRHRGAVPGARERGWALKP